MEKDIVVLIHFIITVLRFMFSDTSELKTFGFEYPFSLVAGSL